MFTTKNYFSKVHEINRAALPTDLQEGYDYVLELTEHYTVWDYYHADADIKATVDRYLADLTDFMKTAVPDKTDATHHNVSEEDAREVAKKLIRTDVRKGLGIEYLKKSNMGASNKQEDVHIQNGKINVSTVKGEKVNYSFPLHSIYQEVINDIGPIKQNTPKPVHKVTKPQKRSRAKPKPPVARIKVSNNKAIAVARIDDAVRFIKRYVLMHGKIKTDVQILNFINSLQRAILERRVRSTSAFAKQIQYIQENLIKLYNKMGREVEIRLQDNVLNEFTTIAGSEKIRLTVSYMKRYVGIQGKHITKDKAQKLYQLITIAIGKGQIKEADPHTKNIKKVVAALKKFVDKAMPADTLQIHSTVLNGIHQALDGCCAACDKDKGNLGSIDGGAVKQTDMAIAGENGIMNSVDFANMKFETLGFAGEWKDFIGDPAAGFSAMISGKPKMGKSYLCADFAGYLARHHGETLYVAGEEKLGNTLQQKIDSVKHACLHVTGTLPKDLSPYSFVVIDSVTRLGLNAGDLRRLKAMNPETSFIYVFQVTKNGQFRGENNFQHDVDVVIEVPKKGRAIQYGRYNQGGEMEIFRSNDNAIKGLNGNSALG